MNLGIAVRYQGDFTYAKMLLEESLAINRQREHRGGIAGSLINLGVVLTYQGDSTQAIRLHEESLALFRELGDKRGCIVALTFLARTAVDLGDYSRIQVLCAECLDLSRELGDRESVAECLELLGIVRDAQGQPLRAVRLWSAADAIRNIINVPLDPNERVWLERRVGSVRARLPQADWEAAWTDGQAMTLEQAVAYALDSSQ
jgi:tetratricopeptide (TPR) repeat protein